MKKTGPKPKREDGFYITAKGYLRGNINGKLIFQHVYFWIQKNGPIPHAHHLHHINGNKQDNRIENLQLVTATEHKRLHSGCEVRGGVWWKPCKVCNGMFPINEDHFYLSREGYPLYGRCRKCHIKIVVKAKRIRLRKIRLEASNVKIKDE